MTANFHLQLTQYNLILSKFSSANAISILFKNFHDEVKDIFKTKMFFFLCANLLEKLAKSLLNICYFKRTIYFSPKAHARFLELSLRSKDTRLNHLYTFRVTSRSLIRYLLAAVASINLIYEKGITDSSKHIIYR